MRKRGRRLGLVGLIGASLAGLLPGCFVNKDTVTKPYVETAVVSDYVGKHGALLKGQVRQDLVNVNLNDRLSAFVWENYSLEEGEFNERDFGVNYVHPINDKVSVRAGFQHWTYPSGTFGDYDDVVKAGVHYSGLVDLDLDITQFIPKAPTESGIRFYLKGTKSVPICKKEGFGLTVTPSLSTAYVNNYWGVTGLSQITPGVKLGVNSKGFGFNAFVNQQFGLISEIDDFTWGGASVGYKF